MLAPDLHVHSTFSTLDGLGTPKAVVERAKELGWGAVALTEHGWMGSAPPLYKAARAEGMNPIIGCELYVVPDEFLGLKGKEYRSVSHHLTVLALSKEGYQNLVAWTTFSNQEENFYYKPRISLEAMAETAPWPLHHNVILTGCLGGELCSALAEANGNGASIGQSYVRALNSIFPNVYVELQHHRRRKYFGRGFTAYEQMCGNEQRVTEQLVEVARATGTPLIVTNDSHFQRIEQRKSHLAMVASSWRHRETVRHTQSQEQRMVEFMPEYGYWTNYMQSMEKVAEGLDKDVRHEALSSAIEISREADIRLDPLDNFNFSIPFSGYSDPVLEIRRRSKRRLAECIRIHGDTAKKRFNYELESMGDFAHYLLLMADFIRAATKQGILTNSRGSAANSLVCYTLGIHNVDPIRYGLIFSRFFNPARKKLPDIDIDIEDDRYDDFMRIVRERITELEGDGQLVQICNYGTFANRSAFKLIADALGMDKEKQEEITKLLPQMIDSGMVDEEADVYAALKEEYPDIYELASGVFDGIRNVSQHACGWLFGTASRPIKDWVPLVRISSSGVSVTAFNLKSLDDLGLVKGDFLRLKSLSVIKRTLNLMGKNVLDLEQIPLDDEATFERLRAGKTEGIFTLQGKENRRGCIEVEVASVHDVIRTVAIYRPALTREHKNVTYNARRKGYEEVVYPHEIAEKVVGDTFGVPVFQEQAMELGYMVGMSDAEVDEIYQAIKLAKGVGRGAKEAFAEIRPKFISRAKKMGLSKDERTGIWNLLVSFQGYGFNKGHATSYGILATRSAYLATHGTQEFFTSLLDVYPEKHKYIAAARAEGFRFLPPDINFSGEGFSFDKIAGGIRVGLARVKKLGPVARKAIVAGQPYASFDDFRERIPKSQVKSNQVEALSVVGGFASVGLTTPLDDDLEFEILGFTLKKPRALKGITPKHISPRTSQSGWTHDGRERGVDLTQPRHSVSKLFYAPKNSKLVLKASPWAGVKTWLWTVLDENGLPFEIMAPEDKTEVVKLLKFLVAHCQGKVFCLDGAIRQPFLTDGPMGFRLSSVTGAHFDGDPQVWENSPIERKAIIELHRRMRVA